jgi:hypothetical protein
MLYMMIWLTKGGSYLRSRPFMLSVLLWLLIVLVWLATITHFGLFRGNVIGGSHTISRAVDDWLWLELLF